MRAHTHTHHNAQTRDTVLFIQVLLLAARRHGDAHTEALSLLSCGWQLAIAFELSGQEGGTEVVKLSVSKLSLSRA